MFKRNPTSLWFPGEIIGTSNEPRSFIVKDNDGVSYRRNEEHIFKTPENKVTDPTKECLPQEIPQNINTENVNIQNDIQESPYVTRRGRQIVTPARYK